MQKAKKNAIVITSIYHPTEAVKAYSKLKEYYVIVVGDKKTPAFWDCENVEYLSIENHKTISTGLAKLLPVNHYSRKMIGYLRAIALGADVIVDMDDDNIPKKNWFLPKFENNFSYIPDNKGFINIYQLYTNLSIWPRGLPLRLINYDFKLKKNIINKFSKIGIWQGLADSDPDVDAIYRLTNNTLCFFKKRKPIVLGKGTLSPINTQNTFIRKELFSLLYLPTYVSFRFTDILRGYVAQPIMWLYDFHVGFIGATVIQKRNQHDYMNDFASEMPMYLFCEKITEIASNVISKNHSIKSNLFNVYEALLRKNIVKKKELTTLSAWLKDIE